MIMRRAFYPSLPALLTAFLFLPSWFATGPLTTQGGVSPVRVIQWNVYYGKGTDEVYNLERQVNTVVSFLPDVVMMNEVLPGEANQYRQLLNSRTGVAWHAHHVPAQADGTGNLILSKYAFVSTSSYRMRENGQYSRAVAQATVNVNGADLSLFSTHLDQNDSSIRLAQVLELREFASRFPKPHIVAGDFNASPHAHEMKRMRKGYTDTWEQALSANTAFAYIDNPAGPNTRTHRERIDYILYTKKPKSLRLQEAAIPDLRDLLNALVIKRLGTLDDLGVRPSDHNLQLATFSFRTQ